MVSFVPTGAVQNCMVQFALVVVRGHSAVDQRIQRTANMRIVVIHSPGTVSISAGDNLLNGCTEDILILHASFLSDLHICTIQGTQGYRTVKHQLHIAGAGSLCAGRRDLLRNIRGGDDVLSVGAVIVLHEHHFQLILHIGIVVHQLGDPVDIADNGLGPGITGSGLCTENESCGLEIRQFAVFQAEVDIHNRQGVHQLPLVLVQTLDLDVKNEIRIQFYALTLGNDLAKLLLLLPLHVVELTHQVIIDHGFQFCQTVQIGEEVAANTVTDQLGQFGVTQTHPATGCNTVGLVLETLGINSIPIPEQIVLQNLAVDLSNAIDVTAHIDAEVCHMGGVVPNDKQIGMLRFQLFVDTDDNIHDLRHHGTQKIQIPLFQRFAHNGMVGVGEGLLCDGKGLLKIHALCHQQTDQFRNGHCRVGIIELHGKEFRKAAQIGSVGALVDPHHILQGCRAQEILLLDTQTLAFPGGIVGIQYAGNVLSFVLLCQSPEIVLVVKGVEVQFFLRFALPQTQRIDILRAIADNRHVVRHSQNRMIRKLHLDGMVVPAVSPGITELAPIVSSLALTAIVIETLLEQAKAIPQAVTGQRNIATCGTVQEACGQSAQTTVTQSGIFDLFQTGKIHATLCEQLLHLIQDAQIVKIAVHQTADQVLRRNIVSLPLGHTGTLGMVPIVRNSHHHSIAQGLVKFLRCGILQGYVVGVLKLCFCPFQNIQAIITHIFILHSN